MNPTVLWAQRQNEIFLTIQITDPTQENLSIQGNEFSYSCKSKTGGEYSLNLELFGQVESFKRTLARNAVELILVKKEAESWPRLLHEKTKLNFIKTDFSKWVDDDEEAKESFDHETIDENELDYSKFMQGQDMAP